MDQWSQNSPPEGSVSSSKSQMELEEELEEEIEDSSDPLGLKMALEAERQKLKMDAYLPKSPNGVSPYSNETESERRIRNSSNPLAMSIALQSENQKLKMEARQKLKMDAYLPKSPNGVSVYSNETDIESERPIGNSSDPLGLNIALESENQKLKMDAYLPDFSALVSASSNRDEMKIGASSVALTSEKPKPRRIRKGPFYLMDLNPLPRSDYTGATNWMSLEGLKDSFEKFTTKKTKDSLSSFLPNLPGNIDTPGSQDNSSLRGLIEKPPVVGKELHQLSYIELAGFRLHPGPLPEQYRLSEQTPTKKKKKKDREPSEETIEPPKKIKKKRNKDKRIL